MSYRVEFVWFCSVLASFATLIVGSIGGRAATASTVAIFVIAAASVRAIGLYFMDIRSAPPRARLFFDVCVVLGVVVIVTAVLVG